MDRRSISKQPKRSSTWGYKLTTPSSLLLLDHSAWSRLIGDLVPADREEVVLDLDRSGAVGNLSALLAGGRVLRADSRGPSHHHGSPRTAAFHLDRRGGRKHSPDGATCACEEGPPSSPHERFSHCGLRRLCGGWRSPLRPRLRPDP